jgi:predicted phosphodiesterase
MKTHPAKKSVVAGPILVCGDVHGKLRHVIEVAQRELASAVVLLGDIEVTSSVMFDEFIRNIESLGAQFVFIHGNHDADLESNWRAIASEFAQARNIDGRVITLKGGLRLAGLGGVFRGEVWYPRATENADDVSQPAFGSYDEYVQWLNQKQGLKRRLEKLDIVRGQAVPDDLALLVDETRNGRLRKHKSTIFPNVYNRLADLRADVLICHEAPSCHPNGFQEIDILAQSMQVKMVWHGHHHDRLDYSSHFERLGFRAYGVGLRGVTALCVDSSVEVVVPGELDQARNSRNI